MDYIHGPSGTTRSASASDHLVRHSTVPVHIGIQDYNRVITESALAKRVTVRVQCGMLVGDHWTGALHVLHFQLSPPSLSFLLQ